MVSLILLIPDASGIAAGAYAASVLAANAINERERNSDTHRVRVDNAVVQLRSLIWPNNFRYIVRAHADIPHAISRSAGAPDESRILRGVARTPLVPPVKSH